MERALETFVRIPAGRRVVAAGDMLELGALESEAHRTMGEQVARSGAALFAAAGPRCLLAAETARAAGCPEVRHFPDSAAAAEWLPGAVRPGDLILVKGSRGAAMERVVEALRSSLGEEA
jgi:UDP-N-acetylmuramoyl-tripeptide--D-alanyl-D-alanine ligase